MRRRATVLEFLRGPLAYVEQPSDRERRQHLQEARAREDTAPRPDHVFNKSTREAPMAVAIPVPRDWYENHDNLAAVARHAKEAGTLDARDVWDFLDAPWHWDELYEAWQVWLAAENAAENRITARLDRAA